MIPKFLVNEFVVHEYENKIRVYKILSIDLRSETYTVQFIKPPRTPTSEIYCSFLENPGMFDMSQKILARPLKDEEKLSLL
jgi:hypothetical protein